MVLWCFIFIALLGFAIMEDRRAVRGELNKHTWLIIFVGYFLFSIALTYMNLHGGMPAHD